MRSWMAAVLTSLLMLCLRAQSLDQLPLVRVLELKGRTFHVQGIDAFENRLWVTSVDRATRSGYLHEFDRTSGAMIREVKVQDGVRFHPGGIAGTEESLWI